MAKIETWFPVTIYTEENLFPHEQNKVWKDYSIDLQTKVSSGGDEWEGGTYTTHSTPYELSKDPIFQPLVQKVTEHVQQYAILHNSSYEYRCLGGWLNISDSDNFQEFHTHNDSTISAVYYISAPPSAGKIVFEDPKEPDMLPLKNISQRNDLSFVKVGYQPVEGMLIIFRSYLRHSVLRSSMKDLRISAAFNF